MKEKLINIKLILRIVISCFVIFSCVKSCSKAYTWDEFVYFSDYIRVSGTQYSNYGAAHFINNLSSYEAKMTANGVNFESYDNFFIYNYGGYPNSLFIYLFNYNSNGSASLDSSKLTISNITGKQIRIRRDFTVEGCWDTTGFNTSGYTIANCWRISYKNI